MKFLPITAMNMVRGSVTGDTGGRDLIKFPTSEGDKVIKFSDKDGDKFLIEFPR